MKFGKQIEQRTRSAPHRYREKYLNYRDLKRVIKTIRHADAGPQGASPAALDPGQDQFGQLLKHQLDKINNFVELQWEVLNRELKIRLRASGPEALDPEALDRLAEDIVLLDDFVVTNHTGFRKITKKCDKKHSTNFSAWFMPRVEVATFRQWDIDLLLLALGQLHERRRQQLRPLGAGGSPAGPSPEQLRREGDGDEAETPAVETYLVPPDMLMRVKVSLLKHLQVDAPSQGHSPPPSSSVVGRARHVRVASDGRGGLGQGSIRQSTGEVYFDGPGGELCGERLPVGTSTAEPSRVPAAFCCRWVGDATGGTEVDFFVDVQGASGGTTAVPLKQRDLAAFATGSLQGRSESEPLHRVQAAIRERSLRPSVRATFRRSTFAAFGDPGSEVVAWTTVDEDLVFYDEPEGSDSAAWCQSLPGGTRPLPDRRIACEQAVLRVCRGRSGPRGPGPSAATGGPHDEELEWPEELRALKLRRAHGFSKALHGTALLRGELAPVRPAWLHEGVPGSCSEGSPSTPAGTPSESPAAAAAGSRALAPGPSAGSQAAPAAAPAAASASPPRPPGWCRTAAAAAAQGARRLCARRAPVELRVDPKVPLAIERTALAWMRSAALLSGLSQLLLSSDDQISQLNGFLVALVALTFAFWPVVDFRRAALRLREASGKGHQPKVNRLLPQVLSGLLAFVLVAILLVDVLFNDAE